MFPKRVKLFSLMPVLAANVWADPPTIHATWSEPGDPPVLNLDYFLSTESPASADYPNVELVTGSLTWRIWSTDPDNEDELGDIGVISCPHADNFAVTISNLSDPFLRGARNVKSIALVPSSSTYHSSISDARIYGDLIEEVVVVPDGSGQGGDVKLFVFGDVPADMTLHRTL